jgi:hypothetical protein
MMRRAAETCVKLGCARTVDVWIEQPARFCGATDYLLREEQRVFGRRVKSEEKGMFRLEICSADDPATPRYASPYLEGCGNPAALAAESEMAMHS